MRQATSCSKWQIGMETNRGILVIVYSRQKRRKRLSPALTDSFKNCILVLAVFNVLCIHDEFARGEDRETMSWLRWSRSARRCAGRFNAFVRHVPEIHYMCAHQARQSCPQSPILLPLPPPKGTCFKVEHHDLLFWAGPTGPMQIVSEVIRKSTRVEAKPREWTDGTL